MNPWRGFTYKNCPEKKMEETINLTENSWVKVVENAVCISPEEFTDIWNSKPTTRHTIFIYGRHVEVPRTQVLYGEHTYSFSGNVLQSENKEYPEYVKRCLDYAKKDSPEFNWNGALVNFYKDGSQYIGEHSDDEKDLQKNSPIYSFSFGQERVFRIRNKKTLEIKNLKTKNNSLIIMGGEMQKEFTHQILKTLRPVGKRINVTIRCFNEKS